MLLSALRHVSLESVFYLSFGGHQFALCTNAPEVGAFVGSFYGALRSPDPEAVQVEIEIMEGDGAYWIRGSTE